MNNSAKMTLSFSQNMQQSLPTILPSLTDVLQEYKIQEEGRDSNKIRLHLSQNSKQDQDKLLDALTEVFDKHNIQEEEAIVIEFTPTQSTMSTSPDALSSFGPEICIWKCMNGRCGFVCT